MWPGIVVVVEVILENAVQMPFVEHDHVVEALPAYRTDDSFTIWILPGCMWCDRHFFDTHAFDALGEIVTLDAVAIANEKTWCFLVGQGVDDLLGGPFGVEIRGNVEVNDLPPV